MPRYVLIEAVTDVEYKFDPKIRGGISKHPGATTFKVVLVPDDAKLEGRFEKTDIEIYLDSKRSRRLTSE